MTSFEKDKMKDEILNNITEEEILNLDAFKNTQLLLVFNGSNKNQKLEKWLESILNSSYENLLKISNIKNLNLAYKIIKRGKRSDSKFIINVKDFIGNKGWRIVISLISSALIENISESEKQSWFSNFGPLDALFYNMFWYDNTNIIKENTWLIFEPELKLNSYNLRPDLLVLTKCNNVYNLVILELKQWSFHFNKNNEINTKYSIDNGISEKLYKYKKNITEHFRDEEKLKIYKMGYLFNSKEEHLDFLIKKEFDSNDHIKKIFEKETNYRKYFYSREETEKLSTQIFVSLTKENCVDELKIDEVIEFINKINGSQI